MLKIGYTIDNSVLSLVALCIQCIILKNLGILNFIVLATSFIAYGFLLSGVCFWKKYYKLLNVYLLYLAVSALSEFGSLVEIGIATIIAVTKKSDPIKGQDFRQKALVNLYDAVIDIVTLFLYIWSFFIIYIEYKYLKGRVENGLFKMLEIGYTLDGLFDPDHEDFYIFCLHVHKWIKVVGITFTIIVLISSIQCFFMDSINVLDIVALVAGYFTFGCMLVGTFFWKKFYKLLNVYLFYTTGWILIDFGVLGETIAATIIEVQRGSDPVDGQLFKS
ncbi:hypothetical protein FO519_007822 [Halicephalobus sp. NKZ332]|nr:hypothetical protein FO519_007822 [Halicephalobus sp. NKZ332]